MTPDPISSGKFGTRQCEAIWQVTLHGFQDESSGESESPSGWFALVVLNDRTLIPVPYVGTIAMPPGGYVIREDSQGFVSYSHYPDANLARKAYDELDTQYQEWLGDDLPC